jgi:hypothetical protein
MTDTPETPNTPSPLGSIPYQLVGAGGTVTANGTMPWFYVQPRILKYDNCYYALISDAYGPGPGTVEHPNQYIYVGSEDRIWEPDPAQVVKVGASS